MNDIITPSEMNNERLYELFKTAYMKPEYDSDGDIRFKGPSGFHQIVSVDTKKELIKFMSIFRLKKDRDRIEKLEWINKLNDTLVFSRYSIHRENSLMVDYFLPYEEGLTPFHIMGAMKWFDQATLVAIRERDESDLLD